MEIIKKMNIEIKGKPIATARLDLIKFREAFSQMWDIGLALEAAVRIDNKESNYELLFKTLQHMMDWGYIFNIKQFKKSAVMNFKFFNVDYKNMVALSPGVSSTDARKYNVDIESKDGQDIIVVEDLIGKKSFTLMNFLKPRFFTYGSKNWNIEITDKDLK